MIARQHIVALAAAPLFGIAAVTGSGLLMAEEPVRPAPWPTAERPAYPESPSHGAVDGNGSVIPCRCRFQGQEFRVGEEVCMSTPSGVLLARCDLMQNNTSWVPTHTPCTVSRGPDTLPDREGRSQIKKA